MVEPGAAAYHWIMSSRGVGGEARLKTKIGWETFDGRKFEGKGTVDFERCGAYPKFRFFLHGPYYEILQEQDGVETKLVQNGGRPGIALNLPQLKKWSLEEHRIRGANNRGRLMWIQFEPSGHDLDRDIKVVELIIPTKVQQNEVMEDSKDYAKLMTLAVKVAIEIVATNIAFHRFAQAVVDELGEQAPAMI